MRRIWPGTKSRHATEAEQKRLRQALRDLENERLSVVLVPAPEPHYEGHMIRAVEMRNPRWYRDFVAGRWTIIKRWRIMRACRRVIESGVIRGNGYEGRLLSHLEGY